MHGGGCKHGKCLMPQSTVCCLTSVQCCYKPIGSVGAFQGGHGKRLPVSSTLSWCSALPVYGFACQAALRLYMVMVCMLCGAQCSLYRVCAPITCRANHSGNSMLPSGTWCCGSWRCTWHTSTTAKAWQHLACRHLWPSLPVLWWQTKLLGMTQQRKQPCEMNACHNLTLSNELSMTMSWPLSIALHFLSMALATLAKPFFTVAC